MIKTRPKSQFSPKPIKISKNEEKEKKSVVKQKKLKQDLGKQDIENNLNYSRQKSSVEDFQDLGIEKFAEKRYFKDFSIFERDFKNLKEDQKALKLYMRDFLYKNVDSFLQNMFEPDSKENFMEEEITKDNYKEIYNKIVN